MLVRGYKCVTRYNAQQGLTMSLQVHYWSILRSADVYKNGQMIPYKLHLIFVVFYFSITPFYDFIMKAGLSTDSNAICNKILWLMFISLTGKKNGD